jgi:sugar (pentulose or hexulose) kinase
VLLLLLQWSCSPCRPGELVVSLGTSATLFGVSGQPIIDPTCAVCPFCDATGELLLLLLQVVLHCAECLDQLQFAVCLLEIVVT